ncbi:hypothetical protein SAMN00790413_06323 [Deinococcus hopiensis KR-140]|uniref:Uncharacterized protein n=1 Tax=Deinococcus hopiensis KR-140 TaxID=695939 RepID=A0A1W1VUR4_9DEIO|nr:hypothetical protein SAMN00790413_06323 [Deinococcus hopiensis KR-140]
MKRWGASGLHRGIGHSLHWVLRRLGHDASRVRRQNARQNWVPHVTRPSPSRAVPPSSEAVPALNAAGFPLILATP